MARVCEYCQKRPRTGHLVSHSNIKTKTRWNPNLKRMKAVINGTTRTIRACSRCVRSGLLTRPVKRTYKAQAQSA